MPPVYLVWPDEIYRRKCAALEHQKILHRNNVESVAMSRLDARKTQTEESRYADAREVPKDV
jgi:hypothetical protein